MSSILTAVPLEGILPAGLKSPIGGRRHDTGGISMSTPMAGVRRYKARKRSNNPARPIRVLSPRRHGGSQKLIIAAFTQRSMGELSMTTKPSAMRGTNTHTRRNILTAAPAAGLALVTGAGPVEAAETPVMALFREWQAARAEETRLHEELPIGPAEDALVDALGNRRGEIEDAMMAAPCETAHDWLLKLAAWTGFGLFRSQDEGENPQLWAEARKLVEGAR